MSKPQYHYSQKKTLPRKTRDAIFARDDYLCFYCGQFTNLYPADDPINGASVDHLDPESRGGSSDPSNLVTACRSCNAKKRFMNLEEYREKLSYEFNGYGRAAGLLLEGVQACSTPYDESVYAAIEWLQSQIPVIRFWGELSKDEREK